MKLNSWFASSFFTHRFICSNWTFFVVCIAEVFLCPWPVLWPVPWPCVVFLTLPLSLTLSLTLINSLVSTWACLVLYWFSTAVLVSVQENSLVFIQFEAICFDEAWWSYFFDCYITVVWYNLVAKMSAAWKHGFELGNLQHVRNIRNRLFRLLSLQNWFNSLISGFYP